MIGNIHQDILYIELKIQEKKIYKTLQIIRCIRNINNKHFILKPYVLH